MSNLNGDYTWLQPVITGVVAAIGGFMTAIIVAIKSAWRLSEQLSAMRADLVQEIAEVRNELLTKMEVHNVKVDDRMRIIEREQDRRVPPNNRR